MPTNTSQPSNALFSPGVFTITPAALDTLSRYETTGGELLGRFITGDWSELDARERLANYDALTRTDKLIVARYTLDRHARDQVTFIAEPGHVTVLATTIQARRLLVKSAPRAIFTLMGPTEDEPGLWRLVR